MTQHSTCPECGEKDDRSGFSRRSFIRGGIGAAAVAGLAATTLTTRMAFAGSPAYAGDVLVVLSLRGGFDGMSAIVPLGDPFYARNRPTLQVRPSQALPTGSTFWGLHPKLAPLKPWWDAGTFGAVHAVVQPNPTRSHFVAMQELERAAPGTSLRTGWLDRSLGLRPAGTPFQAVGLRSMPPPAFNGPFQELSMGAMSDFELSGVWGEGAAAAADYKRWSAALRALTAGTVLAAPAVKVLSAVDTVGHLNATTYAPQNGAVYPHTVQSSPYYKGDLSGALMDVARLIKARVGLQVVALEFDDWDMHDGLGTVGSGRFQSKMDEFARSLQAFLTDMGPSGMNGVTVLTLSEFGRRVQENGNGGLDHGHGNAVMMFGGGVVGGVVHGRWPGLAPSQLDQGDLRGTVDYRDLLAEVLMRRCGQTSADIRRVFPNKDLIKAVGAVRAAA